MEHNKIPNSFQSDTRINLLMQMAKELSDAPKDQKMAVFLSIQKRANQQNLSFTPNERTLLIQALTSDMNEEEKKRVELIQTLASKLSRP